MTRLDMTEGRRDTRECLVRRPFAGRVVQEYTSNEKACEILWIV